MYFAHELAGTLEALAGACQRLVAGLPAGSAGTADADTIRQCSGRALDLAAALIEQTVGVRPDTGGASRQVVAGPFTLDTETRQLAYDGRTQHLTRSEMDILRHLMERCDRFVPVETLLGEALGYAPAHASPQILRTHVKNLRSKLEPDPRHPRWLLNRPGVGYCLTTRLPG